MLLQQNFVKIEQLEVEKLLKTWRVKFARVATMPVVKGERWTGRLLGVSLRPLGVSETTGSVPGATGNI